MFGVVVCPRCGRAKGVELRKKTTTCQCGFEIRVEAARLDIETQDARKLATLVGETNARLSGAPPPQPEGRRPPSRDAIARIVAGARSAGDRAKKVRAAAEGLVKEFVLFSIDDWRRVMDALGIPEPDAALQGLLRSNVLYEPKPGFYRTV